VALDDATATSVNTAVEVEVLELAFDPAGDTLELTGVTQGENGTVTANLDGSVTYTPDNNFEGTDTFTYTIEDDQENTAIGLIEVTVGDAPEPVVDGIIEDLASIEEEIENYEQTTPDSVFAAMSAVTGDIGSYLTSVNTYAATASLDIQPLRNHAIEQIPVLQALIDQYNSVEASRFALFNTLKVNKQRIDTLKQQIQAERLKPNPDGLTILALQTAYDALMAAHILGAKSFLDITLQSYALYIQAKEFAQSLTLMGAPISMVPFPALPVELNIDEIRWPAN
jgi:hypothetical protein